MREALAPFGPIYPDLGAGVAKFRRKAAMVGAIREMLPNDRREYGATVLNAIRAKHRTLHMRPTPPTTPGWYSPPSVTRLLRWEKPIRMQGDSNWMPKCKCRNACYCDHWGAREKVVYAAAMEAKRLAHPPTSIAEHARRTLPPLPY